MRCLECNEALQDHEAVRKSKTTGEFLDICDNCLGEEFLAIEEAIKAIGVDDE
jgi:hypothetical protein